MRNLKLSNADRKRKTKGQNCPLLLCEHACNNGSVPSWCPPSQIEGMSCYAAGEPGIGAPLLFSTRTLCNPKGALGMYGYQ